MQIMDVRYPPAVREVLEIVHKNRHDHIVDIRFGVAFDILNGPLTLIFASGTEKTSPYQGLTNGLLFWWYKQQINLHYYLPLTLRNEFRRIASVYWVASQQSWKDLAEDFVPYLIAAIGDCGDEESTAKRQRV